MQRLSVVVLVGLMVISTVESGGYGPFGAGFGIVPAAFFAPRLAVGGFPFFGTGFGTGMLGLGAGGLFNGFGPFGFNGGLGFNSGFGFPLSTGFNTFGFGDSDFDGTDDFFD